MTQLLYLKNTYLFSQQANILETGNDDFGDYIILDKTIFYPQGGGQPSDIGKIYSGKNNFQVIKCRLDEDGKVYHYGEYASGNLIVGDLVYLEINQENRLLNTRNHSAGHLLDVAMHELGYSEDLSPTKGYHFQNGAYVEYHGEFNESLEIFIPKIEQKINQLVQQNIPIIVKYEGLGELEVPVGKTPRYVSFENYKGCGCGGTHVKNSGEIGEISIRKVKWKKGVLRVSYEIS